MSSHPLTCRRTSLSVTRLSATAARYNVLLSIGDLVTLQLVHGRAHSLGAACRLHVAHKATVEDLTVQAQMGEEVANNKS